MQQWQFTQVNSQIDGKLTANSSPSVLQRCPPSWITSPRLNHLLLTSTESNPPSTLLVYLKTFVLLYCPKSMLRFMSPDTPASTSWKKWHPCCLPSTLQAHPFPPPRDFTCPMMIGGVDQHSVFVAPHNKCYNVTSARFTSKNLPAHSNCYNFISIKKTKSTFMNKSTKEKEK